MITHPNLLIILKSSLSKSFFGLLDAITLICDSKILSKDKSVIENSEPTLNCQVNELLWRLKKNEKNLKFEVQWRIQKRGASGVAPSL